MNKFVKAIFCIPLAEIKYVILKLENGKRFRGGRPAVLSPLTEITVERKSELYIGKKLRMHNGAKIRVRNGGKVVIGDNVGMSNGCVITGYENVTIGDNVMLGPNVLIYDQDHDYRAEGGITAMKYRMTSVIVGNNVWIGANSVILRGTRIGDNSVIGAGSVVKGTYKSGSVVIQKRIEINIEEQGSFSNE